jgi:hypothetical protein
MVSLDAPKTPQLLCSPVLPPRTDRPPLLTARNSTVFLELPSQGGLPPPWSPSTHSPSYVNLSVSVIE